MTKLFDYGEADLDRVFVNLRTGGRQIERDIRSDLERMWLRFEPYADPNFRAKFARNSEEHFWEMYLAVLFLDGGKQLRRTGELPKKVRGYGPDLCVVEPGRNIWIEAVAPERGEPSNRDRIPDVIALSEGGSAQSVPRRQVELRISGALFKKMQQYERYLKAGIVEGHDLCIVAISGSQFAISAISSGIPPAATAVYPIGDQFVTLDRRTGEIVDSGYHVSEQITRTSGAEIRRSAFLDARFANVSGMIWSRASIGNLSRTQRPIVFIDNLMAHRHLPQRWYGWDEEYRAQEVDNGWELVDVA